MPDDPTNLDFATALKNQAVPPQADPSAVLNALKRPPSLMDQAKQQYPILNNYDIGYKYSEGRAPFMLESWGPGMSESIPGVNRPKEFPNDKLGIEVFDPKTKPIDILGDVVSHHLVKTDPKIKGMYEDFTKSIEPWQEDILHEQHEYAKKSYGEDQSYEDWKNVAGLPAYFRGYPFKQWDNSENMYTKDQMKNLDGMMNYLRGQ
jgi:hypothetical protein